MKYCLLCLFLCLNFGLDALETRTTPLDFILLLDKSLSMEKKVEDVKKFVQSQILDKSLQPGDSLLVILFYGQTEVLLDQKIQSADDLKAISAKLSAVRGDGRYTDIGTALDFTYKYVSEHQAASSRKYFILLTDGRQEAPPGSKYQSLDFSIRHPFLDSAKNIQQAGWKVQILGLGTDTEAENLAKKLSGVSVILPKASDLDTVKTIRADRWIDLTAATPRLAPGASPRLELTLKPHRSWGGTVKIDGLYLDNGNVSANLLPQPVILTLPETDGLVTLELPVNLAATEFISSGRQSWFVTFSGDESFSPGRFEAAFTSVFQDFLPVSLAFLLVFSVSCFIITQGRFKKLRPGQAPLAVKAVKFESSESC